MYQSYYPAWVEIVINLNHLALVMNAAFNIAIYVCKDNKFRNHCIQLCICISKCQCFRKGSDISSGSPIENTIELRDDIVNGDESHRFIE